jgi:hypothetical protein
MDDTGERSIQVHQLVFTYRDGTTSTGWFWREADADNPADLESLDAESLVGPFETEAEAVQHARSRLRSSVRGNVH